MDTSKLTQVICFGIPSCVILIITGIYVYRYLMTKTLLRKGDNAFLQGSYKFAESVYSHALKYKISRSYCHLRLGLLFFMQQEFSKAIASFSDALDSNTGLMSKHLEKLCAQLNITPGSTLFDCFRKGEFLSLDHKFISLDKDLEAKKALAIHLWKVYRPSNPSFPDSKDYISLGTDSSGVRIAEPNVEILAGGIVRGKVEFETTNDGIRLDINIFHQVVEFHHGSSDEILTFSISDLIYLTDTAILSLMNRWKINEDTTYLSEIHNDINRALTIIITFFQNRKLGEEISDITFHLHRVMPIYWHEAVSRKETLSGTTWTYTFHQWTSFVNIETEIKLDRKTWHKGYFNFSKDNRRKLADNTRKTIVSR